MRSLAYGARWQYDNFEDYLLAVTEEARQRFRHPKVEDMAVSAAEWTWAHFTSRPTHIEASMRQSHPNRYFAPVPDSTAVDAGPSMIFDDTL